MSKVSILNGQPTVTAVEEIEFWEWDNATYSHDSAQKIKRARPGTEHRVNNNVSFICNKHGASVVIESEKQAKQLMRALALAIKLEWFNK